MECCSSAARIVPLPGCKDVLTVVLRQGALVEPKEVVEEKKNPK